MNIKGYKLHGFLEGMLLRVTIFYLTLKMFMNAGSTISTPKQNVKWHHITVPEENATIISLVHAVMGT
jgi:hypothetical protein